MSFDRISKNSNIVLASARRYDRNIRAIELIRERRGAKGVSNLFSRIEENGERHGESAVRNLFHRIPPLCIPIAPISFVVFSRASFFSRIDYYLSRIERSFAPQSTAVSAIPIV